MVLFGTCLGPYSPKYCPILPKFSPKEVLYLANKILFENVFEGFEFLSKKKGPKISISGTTLTLHFPLKIAEIERNKH